MPAGAHRTGYEVNMISRIVGLDDEIPLDDEGGNSDCQQVSKEYVTRPALLCIPARLCTRRL